MVPKTPHDRVYCAKLEINALLLKGLPLTYSEWKTVEFFSQIIKDAKKKELDK